MFYFYLIKFMAYTEARICYTVDYTTVLIRYEDLTSA